MSDESSYDVLPATFLRRRATFEAARVGEGSNPAVCAGITEILSDRSRLKRVVFLEFVANMWVSSL